MGRLVGSPDTTRKLPRKTRRRHNYHECCRRDRLINRRQIRIIRYHYIGFKSHLRSKQYILRHCLISNITSCERLAQIVRDSEKEDCAPSDAALRIHRDAPRMVPPEGEERAKSGPAWVRDDLWLYRVRSLRSQSFPFIVSLREFSFLAGARRPLPTAQRYITYRVSAFNFARYPCCDRRLCEAHLLLADRNLFCVLL